MDPPRRGQVQPLTEELRLWAQEDELWREQAELWEGESCLGWGWRCRGAWRSSLLGKGRGQVKGFWALHYNFVLQES